MSDATLAELENAIRAHLEDEGQGGIVTAWVLVSNSLDGSDDDEGTIWMENASNQPRFITMGLLESASVLTRGFVYAVMAKGQLDEGDD